MGHYKSNLRDIEFNLFEVFGRPGGARHRARTPRSTRTPRAASSTRSSGWPTERAGRVAARGRPQPAGLRPGDPHGDDARGLQEDLPGLHGRRVVADGPARGARRHRRPAVAALGGRRADPRRQPGRAHVRLRPGVRARPLPARHRGAAQGRRADGRRPLGRHHGAHRAGRRLRRRRRPHQGGPAGRRHLAHRGRQALHHHGRARHGREHHPPGAGPPRGRRPGHQGPVAVHRPEVPLRLGDRRARRAQRRLRHQRRAQDGPQGLHHLRAHLRRARAGRRLAGRRGARRHRADVQDHRVRPDDGRHEGDRHAVDRLPQRARLRQDPRAGRGPDADDRQDRAARDDHPPPRRAPLADDAEGVRRGHARAGPLHRHHPGRGRPGRGGRRRRATRTTSPYASTTCCCRSSRATARRSPTSCSAAVAADLRRLRLPAGLPDRAVHPGRQDRHPLRGHHGDPGAWTSSSARSCGTRARR